MRIASEIEIPMTQTEAMSVLREMRVTVETLLMLLGPDHPNPVESYPNQIRAIDVALKALDNDCCPHCGSEWKDHTCP